MEPCLLQEYSIVTLSDGYYESCLPFARHTPASISAALTYLEQEWVLGPLGLGRSAGDGLFGPGGAMLPEHAADLQGVRAPIGEPWEPAKRQKKGKGRGNKGTPPTRRLFAVGEDCALAALRSALNQMATFVARARCSPAGRLEYWTAAPEGLIPAACELAKCTPPGLEVVVLAVSRCDSAMQARDAPIASVLEEEFRQAGSRSAVVVRSLSLSAATFARQARQPFDTAVPLSLRLPSRSTIRRMLLSATPLVFQPNTPWRRAGGHGDVECSEIQVVCRTPAAGISVELLYGVPLLLAVAANAGASENKAFTELVSELRAHEQCLILAGRLCPVSLLPLPCICRFVVWPVPARCGDMASEHSSQTQQQQFQLCLRGLACADIWQPPLRLQTGKETFDAAGTTLTISDSVGVTATGSFDPFVLDGQLFLNMRCPLAVPQPW